MNGIGVSTPGELTPANHILGNGGAGVEISTNSTLNVLENNLIGFAAPGMILGNAFGVFLNQVENNFIGGSSLTDGANTITGNNNAGVYVSGNNPNDHNPVPFGDVIKNNYIGTGPDGNSPGAFTGSSNPDVGVFVLNSAFNQITGNVVSGNHAAGVELFGAQSQDNSVLLNTIGSNSARNAPILTSTAANLVGRSEVYSVVNRQDYGVFINGAPNNTVGFGNNILGNMNGVHIQGSTATGNLIEFSAIGPASFVAGSPNIDGLGNVNGVYISNTSGNTILNDTIARNIVTGVSIVGPTASSNVVQHNLITSNGGFGLSFPDGVTSTGLAYFVAPVAAGETIFIGTGVYIESGTGNVVGTPLNDGKHSDAAADGNTITDNTVAGVYVFNFGNLTTPSQLNSIAGNTIVGSDHLTNPKGIYYIGQYGVFLFDSSGNIPGVPQVGSFANKISQAKIANFREYTGPGATAVLTVPGSTTTTTKVKKKSVVSLKASSVAKPVIVNTSGKKHPLPPSPKKTVPKG